MAESQVGAQKFGDAEGHYKDAIAIYEKMEEPPSRAFVITSGSYSELLRRTGRESEAASTAIRAKKIREAGL